jgi:hypothetical protein
MKSSYHLLVSLHHYLTLSTCPGSSTRRLRVRRPPAPLWARSSDQESEEVAEKGDVDDTSHCLPYCIQEQSSLVQNSQKVKGLAHREGRTRSLQIAVMMQLRIRHKSLTLYPIELGGRLEMSWIRVIRPCCARHAAVWEHSMTHHAQKVKDNVETKLLTEFCNTSQASYS